MKKAAIILLIVGAIGSAFIIFYIWQFQSRPIAPCPQGMVGCGRGDLYYFVPVWLPAILALAGVGSIIFRRYKLAIILASLFIASLTLFFYGISYIAP